ncbi:hypothetical protein QZH41_019258 [Actinostola sp. cb2023]|nr:hypothetical protein QZH41_019258 [Actinostola sp. cb2023]
MADSRKTKETPMSMEKFRGKKEVVINYVDDSKTMTSKSHTSLAPPSRTVKKAQSTSALHRIHMDRPAHSPKKHAPKQEKPKAGTSGEAAAKQALAERRKQAREEAERKAKLDLERQEEERKKKEEEDKRLAEEMAIEEERLRKLSELLKEQEEERLLIAMEEKEQRDREEAERLLVEEKHREEERMMKEEEERLAKIEAERKAKEDEERRKQEEIERQERRRRVEEIMSRTRQAKTGSPNAEKVESTSSTPPQRQHNSAIKDDNMGCVTNDEERLWSHTEALMQKTENSTSEKLENDGIVAEGDNDPNSEEGKLWRVIEGSTVPLSDVA